MILLSKRKNQYYSYDDEGRVLVADGVGINHGVVSIGSINGKRFTYDNAGNIKTEHYYASDVADGLTQYTHHYDSRNLLEEVYRSRSGTTERIQYYSYNLDGLRTQSIIDDQETFTIYSGGKIKSVLIEDISGDGPVTVASLFDYDYSLDGRLKSYNYHDNETGYTDEYHYNYIMTYSGRQVSSVTVSPDPDRADGLISGTSTNDYDHRGRLTRTSVAESHGNRTTFFDYNGEDQIAASGTAGLEQNTGRFFFYHEGHSLADIGDSGINISPIDTEYLAGDNPTNYTIAGNETLYQIAKNIYGDSSLWYVIADANGLQMGPMDQFSASDTGRALRIPAKDLPLKNNATTFNAYNPGEIIGDLTPELQVPPPPPPPKKPCFVEQLVVIVVAVAVTAWTGGAAAGLLGSGFWATVAGAAIGGFVGSVASQAVAVEFGLQDSIDFKAARSAALSQALTAGVFQGGGIAGDGSGLSGWDKFAYNAAKGAFRYEANYHSNRIMGIETEYNFSDRVATSLAAGASAAATDYLSDKGAFDFFGGEHVEGFTQNYFSSAARAEILESC